MGQYGSGEVITFVSYLYLYIPLEFLYSVKILPWVEENKRLFSIDIINCFLLTSRSDNLGKYSWNVIYREKHHSFNEHIFSDHLLSAQYCSEHWKYNSEKGRHKFPPSDPERKKEKKKERNERKKEGREGKINRQKERKRFY